MYLALAAAVIILAVLIIFSFPQFSPIPYYPSNMKDKSLILKALDLKNGQTVIDLGAGDGVVIFEASREALSRALDTRFVALEFNPVLVLILHLRRLFHPNRKSIKIVYGDMFAYDYPPLANSDTTFYLYISPWLIERVISRIRSQLPKAWFVSYFYPIKSLAAHEKTSCGVHNVYVYDMKKGNRFAGGKTTSSPEA